MSTSTPLQNALAFVRHGHAVLPLHGITDGKCKCGNAACSCPGKHPHGRLAPQSNIVRPFEVPSDWFRFRSVDWGSARPFSVGWWAVPGDDHQLDDGRVIPRGALVRYCEWYGASAPNVGLKMTVEEVAAGIVSRSSGERFSYTVVDPSMFQQSGGPSLAERLWKAGVPDLRPADNRRVSQRGAMGGWDQVRARIKGDGERPMLFVFSTCRDTIRTLPALQHDPDRPEDLDTASEDHAADEARYACMSRPYTPPRKEHFVGPRDPLGQPVQTAPRKWKYLSEMTYDEFIGTKDQERQRVRV